MTNRDYWKSSAAASSDGKSSYWRGTYRAPNAPASTRGVPSDSSERPAGSRAGDGDAPDPSAEPSVPEPLHYGSVSARARQAYAAEALRHKDHISAGLLAIFLGVFGIHKFYLGCNQAGFIMLAVSIIGGILTFGLAAAVIWVIAAIEGLIYLTKPQTDFDRIYVLHQRDWF